MKKVFLLWIFVLIAVGSFIYFFFNQQKGKILSPISKLIEKPLDKYTFENLKNKEFPGSEITIGKILKPARNASASVAGGEDNDFTSYIFYFEDQGPSAGSGRAKKASGLINLPDKPGNYPILAMFRGYVDLEKYTIGEGTRHSGEVFAQNNFITLAPDFLGYGESASPSANSIEERFQTYTTALSLLASVKNLNKALENKKCHPEASTEGSLVNANLTKTSSEIPRSARNDNSECIINIKADTNKIGIWGHSNGGHIALSVLEITGKNYPTVLWTPVSKPFPYSILYFTDEFDDHGKALRKVVANFEKDYDIEKYSPTNYLNWINSPIQIHQGGADEAVPQKWSDQLYTELKKLNKEITYYTYPNEDHNFSQGSWSLAIERSIGFYKEHLK